MEDILGFVIFLVIIVISIINKIRTDAKESQERPVQRKRPVSLDDIPEATRRMLYGDGSDIPVAKPRTAASEHHRPTPVTPHPVTARRVDLEQEEGQKPIFTVPPPPPVYSPPHPVPQPAPQMMQPQRPVPIRQTPVQQVRRQPPVMQQPLRREYQQQQRPQPRPRPQPAARHTYQDEEEGPKKKYVSPKPQPQMRQATATSGGYSLHALLASKNDLARGILLKEILGSPKAYEDFGF